MLLSWLQRRKRNKLLAEPLPPAWREVLRAHVRQYSHLPPALREGLEARTRVFLAEKHWEGCDGLALTDEIRVAISAKACLMLLGTEDYYFDQVRTILVYPTVFARHDVRDSDTGLFGTETRSGEAWHRGPVVLAWDEVVDDRRRRRGQNVVIHEFAHKLDELDGYSEGKPPLSGRKQSQRWDTVMRREYRRLEQAVALGEPTLLDPYGLESPAEFFAVASECFFERPQTMQNRLTALYGVLADFYRVDPATWRAAEGEEPTALSE